MIKSGYVYRCGAGDTFDLVALVVYGNEKYSCEILSANPALSDVMVFSGGEILDLPVVTEPTDSSPDEPEMPASAPWKE